jgi:outer membrane lipoprotein-sorting protein
MLKSGIILASFLSGPAALSKQPAVIKEVAQEKIATPLLKEMPLSAADIAKLQDTLGKESSITLNFEQKQEQKMRKKFVTSSGVALFRRPDRLRWVTKTPVRDEWLYDGKSFLNFNPVKREAVQYSMSANRGQELQEIILMVLNFKELDKKYVFKSAIKDPNAFVTIDLIPKEKNQVASAVLKIDTAKNFVRMLRLNWTRGNYTEFSFSNPNHDPIADKAFELQKGTAISTAI